MLSKPAEPLCDPCPPLRHVLREIVAPCMQQPLPAPRIEKDRLSVQYTNNPRHYISDDSLALHYRCGRSGVGRGRLHGLPGSTRWRAPGVLVRPATLCLSQPWAASRAKQ